jgi:hypothetical protein
MKETFRLYSTAKGYVQSAYCIMTNQARYTLLDDSSFFLSFHLLAGFAVELYFKSVLLHLGTPEKTLRSVHLRHHLRGLCEVAQSAGFENPSANFLVDILWEKHSTFEYRYMKPQAVYFSSNLVTCFNEFSKFDTAVDLVVGASAAHGRLVGGAWIFPKEYSLWRLDYSDEKHAALGNRL